MNWVLITGSSTGIGRATGLRLVRRGFGVIAGVRRQKDADALQNALGSSAPAFRSILLDVSDPAQIAAVPAKIRELTGGETLFGLVNNAGVVRVGPTEALSFGDWQQQYQTNFFGPAALTAALLPFLRNARGRIINVGSIGGRSSLPFMSAYTSSKFAMRGWTDALRLELLADGIQVSLVEPGAIATDLWEKGVGAGRQLQSGLPGALRERYGASVEAMLVASEQTSRRAISADVAAQVIERALTVNRPKTKYLVGLDARVQAALAWLLPDRILDAVVSRMLRLPARSSPPRRRPVSATT